MATHSMRQRPLIFQDLSDTVDAQIGAASGLDSIESKLALWYDASNTNFFSNAGLSDGSSVSEWKDLSGNNHHMTQSTASKQATLTKNGMNGLDTMTYSNTSFTNYDPINVGETVHTFSCVSPKHTNRHSNDWCH